ncbi:MAG: NAD-dependent dehydratase [Sphingomicrobium sp.]
MRIALIGATGLVGGEIARRLAGAELLLLSRRPGGVGAREIVAPVEQWGEALSGETIDVAMSALGTTIAKARSREAFDRIDRVAVLDFARAARASGARQFILVSSVGADPDARAFFLATKGRIEQQLGVVGFDRLDILRPGLLRGARAEHRLGEAIALRVAPLADRFLPNRFAAYRSIDAGEVAAAAVGLIAQGGSGQFVHQGAQLVARGAR